ncbi:DNA-binding protein, partial [Escherichia coli]
MATGITEVDVWRASDALLLEGARPTIERVRQKIGRGSPNTVSPHLES